VAEAATIARPYAKAAFAHARDEKVLGAWSKALGLAAGMASDARVAELVGSPNLGVDQVVGFFKGLAGPDQDAPWQGLVREIVENKRLHVLPEIFAQFELLRGEYENELDVQVTSAVELDAARRAGLAAALKTRFKRDVRITTVVDPTLLGGAVIRAGDLVIDGSLKGRLQRMASELAG
jgi:F-type H+-transporting ATPase subunit delta